VIATYADEGTSAWNMNRPGLQAAMDLVRSHGCDILIAYEFSRLTRNASDMESILTDADAAGVTLHLAAESLTLDAAALRVMGSL
jgi:DNA invertase Pin-like site-specific DNA recombinase